MPPEVVVWVHQCLVCLSCAVGSPATFGRWDLLSRPLLLHDQVPTPKQRRNQSMQQQEPGHVVYNGVLLLAAV